MCPIAQGRQQKSWSGAPSPPPPKGPYKVIFAARLFLAFFRLVRGESHFQCFRAIRGLHDLIPLDIHGATWNL